MVNCCILSSEICEKQEVERKMKDELEGKNLEQALPL